MNKWYRSAPVKGALLLIQQVLVVLAVVGLAWLSAYPALPRTLSPGQKEDTASQRDLASGCTGIPRTL